MCVRGGLIEQWPGKEGTAMAEGVDDRGSKACAAVAGEVERNATSAAAPWRGKGSERTGEW